MSFIEFESRHILGIPEVDNQHKEIYNLVNLLYNSRNKRNDDYLPIFENLLKALKEHFDFEENLIKQQKLKNYISHKLEHDRAYKKYYEAYKGIKSNSKKLDDETLNSIKNWLNAHFEKKDIKLKEIFN